MHHYAIASGVVNQKASLHRSDSSATLHHTPVWQVIQKEIYISKCMNVSDSLEALSQERSSHKYKR